MNYLHNLVVSFTFHLKMFLDKTRKRFLQQKRHYFFTYFPLSFLVKNVKLFLLIKTNSLCLFQVFVFFL